MNLKMTEKDKRLLMMVGAVLLLFCSYFFVFSKNMTSAREIDTNNTLLQQKVSELESLKAQEGVYKATVEQNNTIIQEKLSKFPTDMTYEKAIMFVKELEKETGAEMKTISFSLNNVFFDQAADQSGQADKKQTEQTATEGTAVVPEKKQEAAKKLTASKSNLNISYTVSFDGLKKLNDYINKNKEQMNIETISSSFDTASGLLTGSMTLVLYSTADSQIEYKDPVIDNVIVGMDELFSTEKK